MSRLFALLLLATTVEAGELRLAQSGVARVLKRARPAVVTVLTPNPKDFDATGVVVSSSGVILTVRQPFVQDGAPLPAHVSVRFPGKGETQRAEVIDEHEPTNTILLKAKAAKGKAIRGVRADDVLPGMWVLLVGNTFGAGRESTPTASLGVVSGIVRDGEGVRAVHASALVNPGSVGAPVIDLAGNLVGIAAPAVTPAGGQTVVIPFDAIRAAYRDGKGDGGRELGATLARRKLRPAVTDAFGLVVRAAAETGRRALVGVRAGRIPADDRKPPPAPPLDRGKKGPRRPRPPAEPAPVPGALEGHDRSSGVVVSEDGLIVCPLRVTGWPGAERPLVVDLPDGRTEKARVLGRDERLRLALLSVRARGLTVLERVPRDGLRSGLFAIALGYPHGNPRSGTPQLTVGIVSRTGALGRLHPAIRALQTDAGVAGGNRGGPLIDMDGRLMGILLDTDDTSLRGYLGRKRGAFAGNAGLGFAVPFHVLEPLLPRLAAGAVFRAAFLGVGTEVAEGGLRVLSLSEKNSKGATSAARAAGIEKGDILVSLGGHPLVRREDLRATIALFTVDDEVEIVLVRDGRRRSVTARLTER